MEHFDRGERRYQVARLKVKRQWYYGQGRVRGTEGITRMSPRLLGRVVQDPANCSCWGCANDRKDHGLPIQELRMYQDLKEDRMPEETREEKEKASEEGRDAYSDEKNVDRDNPYEKDTECHTEWREAFLEAERNDPLADMFASRSDIDGDDDED